MEVLTTIRDSLASTYGSTTAGIQVNERYFIISPWSLFITLISRRFAWLAQDSRNQGLQLFQDFNNNGDDTTDHIKKKNIGIILKI